MAVIDIKCECGHVFEIDEENVNEQGYCEVCGVMAAQELTDDLISKLERVETLKAKIKVLEQEKKQLEAEIKEGLEGATVGVGGGYRATRVICKTKQFNLQEFKFDHQEMYDDYVHERRSERLMIKAVKQ